MASTATSSLSQESHLSTALAKDRLGVAAVVFFVPADSMTAGWPATRVRTTVSRGELLDNSDLVLSGLILATGLDQQAFVTLDARSRVALFDQLKRRMPAMLQELVAHAEAAVGDAVMARRA